MVMLGLKSGFSIYDGKVSMVVMESINGKNIKLLDHINL